MAKASKHQAHIITQMKGGWALRQFIKGGQSWLAPHQYAGSRPNETISIPTIESMLNKHLIRIKSEGQDVRNYELVPEPMEMELVKWECARCGKKNSSFVVKERITCKYCGSYSIRDKKEWGFMEPSEKDAP